MSEDIKHRQLTGTMNRAIDAYRMWHQKDASNLKETKIDWPSTVFACGRANRIIYNSDKWENKNNYFLYEHFFDTRPYVYAAPDALTFGEFATGAKRSVRRLLKVRDLENDPVVAPVLAQTIELIFTTNDGTPCKVNLLNNPTLCCTLDKKTLIICAKKDLVFISGGKMVVTERGIEK